MGNAVVVAPTPNHWPLPKFCRTNAVAQAPEHRSLPSPGFYASNILIRIATMQEVEILHVHCMDLK